MADADRLFLTTMQAESWLCDPANILDKELLTRESEVVAKLRPVVDELRPLLVDQTHLLHRIAGAEFQVEKLRGRNHNDWYSIARITNALHIDGRVKGAESHLADLRSQAKQLDAAIAPRLQRQAELRAEMDQIHEQKLKP